MKHTKQSCFSGSLEGLSASLEGLSAIVAAGCHELVVFHVEPIRQLFQVIF